MRRVTGMLLRSLIAGLVLGAAGCSGDPAKPGTVPTTSPAVTTSSPVPTQTPVDQQVEAAVRAYYAELELAIRTGKTAGVKRLMLKSCPCYGSARSIDKLAAKHWTAPDAKIIISRIVVHDVVAKSASAEVAYRVAAYDVVDRAERVVSHIPARSDHLDLSLLATSSRRWILANVFNLGGR